MKLLLFLCLYTVVYLIAVQYIFYKPTPTKSVPQVTKPFETILLDYVKNSERGMELELSADDSSYFQLYDRESIESSEKVLFGKRYLNGTGSSSTHRFKTIRIFFYKIVMSESSGKSLFKQFRSHHLALEKFAMEIVNQAVPTRMFVGYDQPYSKENMTVRCGFTYMKLQIKDKLIKIEFKHFCM
ncbi:hypothetical protein CAEBREN_17828 [Caenorhabditis brenneri]|uniref:Uncharacterized protein n=1 Tax=Caenorhabditis brenneri TaxID=135651 RepID=G0MMQ9_CAEBE|nr:hypothetical protein CAEBREN_17828 [Caenorhabditis brenneri]